jgi:transposase
MPQPHDLSRSLSALDQDSTLIAVVEMSQSSWLVGGIIPGIERRAAKKLEASEGMLLALLHRWREAAAKAGRTITRIAVAFEAGRDGFWLARWLQARDVEAHVIHATSIAVSREHRRAKTDRLDAALLQRAFLGWRRGERGHCTMVAVPSLAEEDAKRPSREREALVSERTRIGNRMKSVMARLGIRGFRPGLRQAAERLDLLRTPKGMPLPANSLAELRRDLARLRLINDQIAEIEAARLERLQQEPDQARHPMILLLARVIGIGIETADMLVQEVLSRKLRDRRAVARGACPGEGRGRTDRLARGKRRPPARKGLGQGRQCPGPPRHAAAGLALSDFPEGQCAGAMVSDTHRRRARRHPQDNDRSPGPQAARCALETRHHRRGAAGCVAALRDPRDSLTANGLSSEIGRAVDNLSPAC